MQRSPINVLLMLSQLVTGSAFLSLQFYLFINHHILAFLAVMALSAFYCSVVSKRLCKRGSILCGLYACVLFISPSFMMAFFSVFDLVVDSNPKPLLAWFANTVVVMGMGAFALFLSHKKQISELS